MKILTWTLAIIAILIGFLLLSNVLRTKIMRDEAQRVQKTRAVEWEAERVRKLRESE